MAIGSSSSVESSSGSVSSVTTTGESTPFTMQMAMGLVSLTTLVTAIVLVTCGRRKSGLQRVVSLPPQFLCPITGELMREPVTTADGHVFERSAIERWLATHSTSPMTGMPLEHTKLAPAHAIRQLIERSMERGASKDE